MVSEDRLVHSLKAIYPIVFTLLGIRTEVNAVQFSKACSSIEVTPLPIDKDAKASQSAKAELPISVTLFGMSTDVRLLHPLNA